MDVLNFISWIKRKDYRATMPVNAVTVVGVPDPTRDDKYLSVVVPVSAIGGSYTLPPATTLVLGGVIVGNGLGVDSLGTLSTVFENLQKEITTSYTLTNADNDYTIFINNGATAITISLGAVTIPNFCVGFIQQGLGDVTFVGVTNPIGLKSKGQGYQTYIERQLSTSNYYLLGNTKV